MALNFSEITELFEATTERITKNAFEWTSFLKSASWNYNRRFDEQILIYAQNPNATAVAKANVWSSEKNGFCRWINRGAKGIRLYEEFSTDGRYRNNVATVFDVTQTHETGRTKKKAESWKIKDDYNLDVIATLENIYGNLANSHNLFEAITSASNNKFDSIKEYFTQIPLYGDERITELAVNSIAFMLCNRLGLDTDYYFSVDEFSDIVLFKDIDDTEFYGFGKEIRENVAVGLKAISQTVLRLDRENIRRNDYEQFTELQRGNGRSQSKNSLQGSGRSVNSGFENATSAGSGVRQIRRTQREVVGEEQGWSLDYVSRQGDNDRETVRERAESVSVRREINERVNGERGSDGRTQSERPNEMGGDDEQHKSTSRGDSAERSSLHPINTENMQAEEEKSSAFSIPQEVVIDTLTVGTGNYNGKFRVYEQFEGGNSQAENAEFLKKEYGVGGWTDSGSHKGYFCEYDTDGLIISHGAGENETKLTLSWVKVADEISSLVKHFRYLNAKEKEMYPLWLEDIQKARAEQIAKNTEKLEEIVADNADEENQTGQLTGLDENELRFDSGEFEKLIPHKMRFKQVNAVNGNEIYWVTQEIFTLSELEQFQKAVKEYDGNAEKFYVTVRDLSYYDFDEDLANDVFAIVTADSIQSEPYIRAIREAGVSYYLEEEPQNAEAVEAEKTTEERKARLEKELVGQIVIQDDRRFEIESVSVFSNDEFKDSVSMRDLTFEAETGRPIFRNEKVWIVKEWLAEAEKAKFIDKIKIDLEQSTEINYDYNLGDTVYIGADEYIITLTGDNRVVLQDSIYPLFTKEFSREDFEKKLRENPINDHLIAKNKEAQEVVADNVDEENQTGQLSGAEEEKSVKELGIVRRGQLSDYGKVSDTTEVEVIPTSEVTVSTAKSPKITNPLRKAPIVYNSHPEIPMSARLNFNLAENEVDEVGKKERFKRNVNAIEVLKKCDEENRFATAEEQIILSKYVGWGGLSEAFDGSKSDWSSEYAQLKNLLSEDEYRSAMESTLTAFYTPPEVTQAIYSALENLGFKGGNILEPSCGIGNFIGAMPKKLQATSNVYGVELDKISASIAQQLYQKSYILPMGFEETDFQNHFFEVAIGNVPFGDFRVFDREFEKNKFLIHDYFFAKALDKVKPNGVVAFVTSKGTMDKKDSKIRRYLAERAELLGAIRLPNNTFKGNAGTEVVSDIIFLQKRQYPITTEQDWIFLNTDENGIEMNSYFVEHPEMILGKMEMVSGRFGQEATCSPIEGANLSEQLAEAIKKLHTEISIAEDKPLDEELNDNDNSVGIIPADPTVRNYSYCILDDKIYFRENAIMIEQFKNKKTEKCIRKLIPIRDSLHRLIELQTENYPEEDIAEEQARLNRLYDRYVIEEGRLFQRVTTQAFKDDSSFALLQSLENTDTDENDKTIFKSKADIFFKRTIQPNIPITHCDTASEALSVSLAEKAKVDIEYMTGLCGKSEDEIYNELKGVIFLNPLNGKDGEEKYLPADEYLSGNIRDKIISAKIQVTEFGEEEYKFNLEKLEEVKPKDLDASQIAVKLGATWIPAEDVEDFIYELLDLPNYYDIHVNYSEYSNRWEINSKVLGKSITLATTTYGTERKNALEIIEDTLNMKIVEVNDSESYINSKGNSSKRSVLNIKETTYAQAKQETIKAKFEEWIWADPERRERICKIYNEKFNCIRPREFDGSHLVFRGMNSEITLREHQLNAIAHTIYGGNTLLAHCVGAGKTFEMIASAQESKRLGLCQKSLFAVPKHLVQQVEKDYLQLYPTANILAVTENDFKKENRKRFIARVATGDYDAIILSHDQFGKIKMSDEAIIEFYEEQIKTYENAVLDIQQKGVSKNDFSVKQVAKLIKKTREKLNKVLKKVEEKQDDILTFEELGVDRIYIDEAHLFKNLGLATKMHNIAGISTSASDKSEDLYMKCRYLDKITHGRGIVFATGTPVSNSMTELFTMQRYLQYDRLQELGLLNFDEWASTFGQTVTAVELNTTGTGFRGKTRFSKFYNLPELMSLFKEIADIKTADVLNLPTPKVNYHNVSVEPTEIQKKLVESFAERAEKINGGGVDPRIDNMLKVTTDGRKLGLDQRIIDDRLPDNEKTKVNICVDNVYKIWEKTAENRSTQIVFCDIATPNDKGNFTIYDDIRDKLIAKGIPRKEIEFIHDANSQAKKDRLFAKVRSGSVRVLMGSTGKMGTGTNVQERLVALHDLDCPWRPSDLEQRAGRIVRQGNINDEVHIYRYVTEGTFDAYLYQIIENKQKFISQIMTSKTPERATEDVDETVLNYAEIKSLATGNPIIKEKYELDAEVTKLKSLKASYLSAKYKLEDKIYKKYPLEIQNYKEKIANYEKDLAAAQANPTPTEPWTMTVRGVAYEERKEAGNAILDEIKSVKTWSSSYKLGEYRGFTLGLLFHYSYETKTNEFAVTIDGCQTYFADVGDSATGLVQRIENQINGIEKTLNNVKNNLDKCEKQLEDAKTELEKPFDLEDELNAKIARLAEVNAELDIGNIKSVAIAVETDEENQSDDLLKEKENGNDIDL